MVFLYGFRKVVIILIAYHFHGVHVVKYYYNLLVLK
jgi:hypothetical protein